MRKKVVEENRGVKAGTKRGSYKKKPKPKPRVIETKPLEDLASNFEQLKSKPRKPQQPNIEIKDEEGNIIVPKRPVQLFEKGVKHDHKPTGRPKGSRNRSTVVREILQAVKWGKDPLTGKESYLSTEYQMTLSILNKALKGDVNAYNALMNNSYKPHAQEVESKNANIDLTQFTPEELKGFLKDGDE